MILRWLKLCGFAQNQINPHWKASQNHRRVKEIYESYFHEKPPTHISASYAIVKIFRTGKGIRSIFYIMRFSFFYWIKIIYLEYEKYLQEKLASRNSAFLCVFEHPAEYSSTFVGECLVFISHCVSRLETLDEKLRRKNPLNFVIFPD